MNKPPGHYRDEKGYLYYWDGTTRSYIPDDSFGRVMKGLEKVTPMFLWGYAGIYILPLVILILVVLVVALVRGGFLAILLILIWVGLLLYSINYEKKNKKK